MKVSSSNEWDKLKSIIVGNASYHNWPVNCPDFRRLEADTIWKETPVPSGPVSQYIIDEANEDLENLANFLKKQDIEVHRPTDLHFQERDGFGTYCPRDRLLVIDNDVIDAPMAYGCRNMEIECYNFLNVNFVQGQGIFDAANICRLNDDLLFLISKSGDYQGYKWLSDYYSDTKRIHPVNFYEGFHIDSTIVPVREGLVVLNAKRINEDNIPDILKNWDKIWIHEMMHHDFVDYPYASNFIGMNFLAINPDSIVCCPKQDNLRRQLDKYKVSSQGIELRHSRTLGGGHHCVTLDLVREHNAQDTTSTTKL